MLFLFQVSYDAYVANTFFILLVCIKNAIMNSFENYWLNHQKAFV